MKRVLGILLSAVVLTTLVLPFATKSQEIHVKASAYGVQQKITVTDNSSVARSYVPVLVTGITGNGITGAGYTNSDATDTAMYDDDTVTVAAPYMIDTTQVAMVIPFLGADQSKEFDLFMGGGITPQTEFPIIVGSGGYITTLDNAALEPSDNFSIEVTGYFDGTSDNSVFRKDNAIIAYYSAPNVLTVTSNETISKTDGVATEAIYAAVPRAGQRILSFAGTIADVTFYLSDNGGAPAGILTVNVRNADTDAVIGTMGTLDVGSLTGAQAPYNFSTDVVIASATNIRISAEYSGGDFANNVLLYTGANTITGNEFSYNGAVYTENAATDANILVSHTVATVTGALASGEHDLIVYADSSNLILEVDGTILDTVVLPIPVPNSSSNWVWNEESLPYITYIKESVGGIEVLYYQPTIMVSGTSLPDRDTADGTQNGVITFGSNVSLSVTLDSVINSPSVVTIGASNLDTTSADLQLTLVGMGGFSFVSIYFQYGTTVSYGNTTAQFSATSTGTYSDAASYLQIYTLYHFRAVAVKGALSWYGEDEYFTTLSAQGQTTNTIVFGANVFSDYISTGDRLFTIEAFSMFPGFAIGRDVTKYFQVQLLDTNNTDILGASKLSNWGQRPSSIYFNSTQVTTLGLIDRSAYIVKIIGFGIAGTPTDEYVLQTTDWQGADLTALDSWSVSVARNMEQKDNQVGNYLLNTNDYGDIITDAAGGYFTKGIPYISIVRPQLFQTNKHNQVFAAGTDANVWDKSDTAVDGWRSYVGTPIANDIDFIAAPFGVNGKDLAAGIWVLVFVGFLLFMAGGVLPGLVIGAPALWLGVYWRIIPSTVLVVILLIAFLLFIRQFIVKYV